jgi:hypothetical protein
MTEYRRNFIRFNPESLDIAILSLDETAFSHYDKSTEQFSGDMAGLIVDQSFKGCSLIFVNRASSEDLLAVGYKCIVKVGDLAPLPAQVRWRENLPSNLIKAGFEFLK